MRSVAAVFAENANLEAITLNRTGKTISVATIGTSPDARLVERVQARVIESQAAEGLPDCTFWKDDPDCGACTLPLSPLEQRAFRVEHRNGCTTISRVTCPTAPSFWRWRSLPWPRVVQRDVEFLEHAEHLDEWKPQLLAALLCGALGLGGYNFHGTTAGLTCYVLAYVAGGWFTVEEVWERLRKWTIDVHFLMLAVALGSASIGAWGEGAMLLFLFSLSGALEHFALGRTQREIHALFKDAPKVATLLDPDGHEREIPVAQLQPGMKLLVKPGSQFPVDAEVISGQTAADESNLTGESVPVEKRAGDTALAGTINLWGAVEAVVLRSAGESALQKVIHLIREAQHQKAPAQRFTDKFGSAYTYAVLGLSLVMFFVWWLGFGFAPFAGATGNPSAFYRTMTLLVVASPCALVLSIPSAVLAAIAFGARRGILFRGGAAVEKLAEVRVVALDKTGTLTTGELQVDRIESFPPGRESEVVRIAYSMEKLSTHPLARAITHHGKREQLVPIAFDQFESVTGHGLKAGHAGTVFTLGRREWLNSQLPPGTLDHVPPALAGFSEVWLAGGDLTGRILLRDDIRPQARSVIDQLRAAGVRSVVLTGDRRAAAEKLKSELHLDDVRAELKPEDKVAMIRAFTDAGVKVAMVGDGVNDAPSIAAAHVGVAMGARGSDAALEQADVVLMNDRLENFLTAFRLSQRARSVIRQNLVISLGTVAVLVTFALLGRIPLTLGVIGHEGSTVIVVMNSLRLLLRQKEAPGPASGANGGVRPQTARTGTQKPG
jgi:Cd2+/Zn2+-exporting ATPase